MQFDIRAQGLELTDDLHDYAERRLSFALDWAHHEVGQVMLRLYDLNGPRGGNDKRCQVRIPLHRIRDVVVEETAADAYSAMGRAIERAARTLQRRLSRQREFGRSFEKIEISHSIKEPVGA